MVDQIEYRNGPQVAHFLRHTLQHDLSGVNHIHGIQIGTDVFSKN